MANIYPYLFFNGTCAAAMAFYRGCFGGELNVMKASEAPAAYQSPEKKDWVMHSSLEAKSITLMASDWMMDGKPETGTASRLCLVCDSPDEARDLWGKLTAGGEISDPLGEQFFGWYGAFTDKFGIRWMIQANKAA